MNRLKIVWTAAMSACVVSVSMAAYAALSAPKDTRVGFQASGPAGLKIEGTTPDLNVAEASGNIVLEVPLANLSTGIALRDHHMKEKYLEVPKYGSATLVVARTGLKLPAAGATSEADVPGTLKLHGQERPVTVHYVAKGDGDGFAVEGKFHIRMDEFGISVPSYLGVTVKPDVNVSAAFHVAGN